MMGIHGMRLNSMAKGIKFNRTWDDSSDNFYGDLDKRHLYFCLTNELMAIAHPGHEKIYSADSYAACSTSLKDNYFVRNGKADE